MVQLNKKGLFYTEWFGNEKGLISLLLIKNPFSAQPTIDGMDRLVVLIVSEVEAGRETDHWMRDDKRILVRRIKPDTLEGWLVSGENRKTVDWLVKGDILIDNGQYLAGLRSRLMEWSPLLREQKLLCEFSRFARTYSQAKQDIKDGQVLDAFSNTLASLHYWAHISLVEQGMHPELTVWEQMRRVNPGIYKLFEELTTSHETLEQRVQLVLLACEFSVLTKMETSCALLVRIIGSRKASWAASELLRHPDLAALSLDLPLLLHKLASRGCIREVARSMRERGGSFLELRYTGAE